MVLPYASPDMVRMYIKNIPDILDDDINQYTLNEDRITVDVALVNGLNVTVPLENPPDVIKVLSAKCSALAMLRAIYGANVPNKSGYKDFKNDVEQFLIELRAGEIIL